MKNTIKVVCLLLVLLSSCSKDRSLQSNNGMNNTSNAGTITRTFVGSLPSDGNPYLLYPNQTDCAISFIYQKALEGTAPNGANISAGCIVPSLDMGDVAINQSILKYGGQNGYSPNVDPNAVNYFGKTTTFSSILNGQQLFQTSFYVPPIVQIQNTLNGVISRSGASLLWNGDPNNKNGMVIRVRYHGKKGDPVIENIAFPEDNGQYTITSQLLLGIPSGKLVTLELIRGNINIVKASNGKSVKVYGSSISYMAFTISDASSKQ